MKDQMFFIFTILYLTCSAWITDHKAPFCSVDKGKKAKNCFDKFEKSKTTALTGWKKAKQLL